MCGGIGGSEIVGDEAGTASNIKDLLWRVDRGVEDGVERQLVVTYGLVFQLGMLGRAWPWNQ